MEQKNSTEQKLEELYQSDKKLLKILFIQKLRLWILLPCAVW